MPKAVFCKVCKHPRRVEIELATACGLTAPVIAQRFGVSVDSVKRHRQAHLTPQAKAAYLCAVQPSEIDLEALTSGESQGLLANLVAQRARLSLLSEAALAAGDIRTAVTVERAVTGSLHEVAGLLGMLVTKHQSTSVSVLLTPDYLRLRTMLLDVLRRFPDALAAVSAALAELETAKAEEIIEARPLLIEAHTN